MIVAAAHSRERSPPTGRADIVIPLLQDSIVRYERVESNDATHYLPGAVLSGAHDRFSVRGMGGASSVIGVHFKPAGAAAFFGGELGELRNQTVLLEELWGPAARQLRERLQAANGVSIKVRGRCRPHAEALRACAPIQFSAASHRARRAARLGRVGGRRRLLRPSAPHPRVPSASGHDACRLRAGAAGPLTPEEMQRRYDALFA